MIKLIIKLSVSLFVLAVLFNCANAQRPESLWLDNGIIINDTPGNTSQQNPRIINDGYSGHIIIWEDGRAGFNDIYAQKFDENGEIRWANGGVAVCEQRGDQNYGRLASDGSGGAIVVWQDFRNGNSDIYAQRISFTGFPVWEKEGVAVCTASGNQLAPEIIPDGKGGAIITWQDDRGAAGEDIYAQRIDNNGKPLWQEDGIEISTAPAAQWNPQIGAYGDGGAVIVWTDSRDSASGKNIYAQGISDEGKILWEKDGIPVCSAPGNQDSPTLLSLEDGIIVAWNDLRANNSDIYIQKIDLEGKTLWENNGAAVCLFPYTQEDPNLSPDGDGGAIVTWTDDRAEGSDIYAQRIYRNGKISWRENGRPICEQPGVQRKPSIALLNDKEWIIIWEDSRSEKNKVDLFAQKINDAGTTLWDEKGIPVALAKENQRAADLAALPKGGLVLVWEDNREGNYDIYAQQISSDATLAWGKEGKIMCAATGCVVQQNFDLARDENGNALIVFEDARSGYFNIYAQKVNPTGALAWGQHAIAVAKVAANQFNPRVISDGKGGIFVCWEDHRIEKFPMIRAQRLNSKGQRIWESSLQISKVKSAQGNPLIVSDGASGAIIAWEDTRDILSLADIYAQRISPDGKLLWTDKGMIFVSENGEQVDADMITDNNGGAYLTWTDYRNGDRNPNIYAQHIDLYGKLSWQKEGVMVCGAPDIQRSPKLTDDGTGGIIASWTDKGGGSYDIFAQRINKFGQPLWMKDGIPVNQLSRTQQNAYFGGKKVIVWEDYRYGNWDIFATAVSPDGKIIWNEKGIPIVMIPYTQYAPSVTSWKNGEVIVAWEDYRSGKQFDVYMQKIGDNGKVIWDKNGILVETLDGGRSPKILSSISKDFFFVFWEDYANGGKSIRGQKYLIY
jgi:hypothetical protein